MEGTKFASVSGSYSTQFLGSWKLISQNIEKNSSLIRLYGTFRYGGGKEVNSDYSTFKVNGALIRSGRYKYYPGDTQLGYTDISVAHNADGSFPSKTVSIYADSWHMSGSASGTISGVSSIARKAEILTAPDFLHTENPTITFKNPGGFPINAGIEYGSNHTLLCRVNNIANTGSYTHQLTTGQRDTLLAACPDAKTLDVRFVIGTIIGGGNDETHWSWLDKKMTVQEDSARPVFTDFDFADVNASVTGVTGDNQLLIEGQSTLRVTIPAAKRATSPSGASIKKYILTCGNQTAEAYYSSSGSVTMSIPMVSSGAITVTAVDSRGLKTSVTRNASFLSYFPPVIREARLLRRNGVEAQTTLTMRIQVSPGSIGGTANSVTEISYRYKPTGSSNYIDGTTPITPGAYVSAVIAGDMAEGFTVASDFDLEVTVRDLITSSTSLLKVGSGVPAIDMYRKEDAVGISVGSLYDEQAGGLLQMAGVPVIQSGTNDLGSWMKFFDGTMICRQAYRRSMPRASFVDWYGHLACDLGSPPDFPKEFLEAPLCWYTLSGPWATICTLQTLAESKATASKSDVLMIVRPPDSIASDATVSVDVHVLAIGRWK